MRRNIERIIGPHARRGLCATLLAVGWLVACGSDSNAVIVGSRHVISKTTPTMVVESVHIYIPFKAVVHNGAAHQIVVKGEDNLLAKVSVDEVSVAKWEIVASEDLKFEQHSDLQIEIPFIDMVEITYSGDLKFADDPLKAVHEHAGASDASVDADTSADGGS
jgi:hypothetical protein